MALKADLTSKLSSGSWPSRLWIPEAPWREEQLRWDISGVTHNIIFEYAHLTHAIDNLVFHGL